MGFLFFGHRIFFIIKILTGKLQKKRGFHGSYWIGHIELNGDLVFSFFELSRFTMKLLNPML